MDIIEMEDIRCVEKNHIVENWPVDILKNQWMPFYG